MLRHVLQRQVVRGHGGLADPLRAQLLGDFMEQDTVPAHGTQADRLRAQLFRYERQAGGVHPHAVQGQLLGHDLGVEGGEDLEVSRGRQPELLQPLQAYIGVRDMPQQLVVVALHGLQRRAAYLRRPQFPGNGLQRQAVAPHGRQAQPGRLQPLGNVVQRIAVALDGRTAHLRGFQILGNEFQRFAPVAGGGRTQLRRFHRFGHELDVKSRFLDGKTADLRRLTLLGQRLEKVLTPRVLVHSRVEVGYIFSLLFCHGFPYYGKRPFDGRFSWLHLFL